MDCDNLLSFGIIRFVGQKSRYLRQASSREKRRKDYIDNEIDSCYTNSG
jgi:hypothetical protein